MGVGASTWSAAPLTMPSAPTVPCDMEVLDDMKLGKVIKNAASVQRNVLARSDFHPLGAGRWESFYT